MRVLNVVFEDRIGGPVRRIVRVGERLSEQGVETVLCLPAGTGNGEDYARECGIPVRRLEYERIPRPSDPKRVLRWLTRAPRDILRFVRLFRRERADVVHVNGAFFVIPGIAARLLGLPVVWHLNDDLMPRPIAHVVGRFVAAMSGRVVVAAEAVARHYGIRDDEREVIYAPVDVDHFEPLARNVTRTQEDGECLRVGLLANRVPTKGVEYFIAAASLIRARRKDVEFVLAGAPFPNHVDYYERTNGMISELGLGEVLDDRGFVSSVEEVLKDLDVLVSSSIMEGSPTVVFEGMASGLPVVATAAGGVREMLLREPSRPAGIVVSMRAPGDIAAAVLELLNDRERATRMGENGRYLAEKYFSLERCASLHLDVYKGLENRSTNTSPNGAGL